MQTMNTTGRLLVLLLWASPWVLGGCGERDTFVADASPTTRSESFAACPCPLPPDVTLGGAIALGPREYLVRADATDFAIAPEGVTPQQSVDTTLTMPIMALGDWYEGDGVLHIIGCRNGSLVLVTFGDNDQDGAIDDKLGEYTLANTLQLTCGVAAVSDGLVYLFDAEGRSVLRLADTDANGVPDAQTVFASHDAATSPIIELATRMDKEPGGVLTLSPTRMAQATDEVTVITDSDGDGTPESVKTMLRATAMAAPPRLLAQPQSGATQATAAGIPGTTIELWEVDVDGDKVGQDPLGTVILAATDVTGPITWTQGLTVGQFVRLFDSRADTTPGPVYEVEPNYPRVTELSEFSIDGDVQNVITVTGTGFDATTQVKLIQSTPALELTLTPTIQSPTQLTVTIPILPASWLGRSRLRAYTSASPATEFGGALIVHR